MVRNVYNCYKQWWKDLSPEMKEKFQKYKAEENEVKKTYPYKQQDLFHYATLYEFKDKKFIDTVLKDNPKYCYRLYHPTAQSYVRYYNKEALEAYLEDVEKHNYERHPELYNYDALLNTIITAFIEFGYRDDIGWYNKHFPVNEYCEELVNNNSQFINSIIEKETSNSDFKNLLYSNKQQHELADKVIKYYEAHLLNLEEIEPMILI